MLFNDECVKISVSKSKHHKEPLDFLKLQNGMDPSSQLSNDTSMVGQQLESVVSAIMIYLLK